MPTDEELSELLGRALDDDAPVAPPPDRIAALRSQAERARRAHPRARRARRVLPWLAAAAAAVVGFGVGSLIERGDDGTVGVVEYAGSMTGLAGDSAEARLTVTRTGIGRVVELRTNALPILPPGEFYEVWFVGSADSTAAPDRISAGTFHPDSDGQSNVTMTAAVDPRQYPIVEVTAERGDGNPQATGPVVLRADIRRP